MIHQITTTTKLITEQKKDKDMEQKYKILVVDDEQDLLEILKFNLETEGYEVETAASAE